MAAPKDLYMNFKEITVVTDAANSVTLVEASVDTGLSIRGGFMWLIHLVEMEFDMPFIGTTHSLYAALSVLKGRAVLPTYGQNGLITRYVRTFEALTSGFTNVQEPNRFSFLPPIPVAAPNLSLYAKSSLDHATLRGKDIHCRIGYTTTKLDSAAFLEIAEAWGQGI